MKRILLIGLTLFLIPTIAFAGNVLYYIYDRPNRNTDSLVDVSGTVINRYTYDAFGNVVESQEGISNNFKYVGEQYDSETGFIYLRKRYYDPAIGRFITKDPHPGLNIIPQTKNPYPYCNNNPVNFVDPNGDIILNILGGILGASVSGFLEAMNPNSTWQSVTAAALIGGGVSFFAPSISVNPVLLTGATAATRNVITALIRRDEVTPSSVGTSFALGMLGGAVGQGIGWLSESDVLGKMTSANVALWLGAAFSDYKFNQDSPNYYNRNVPDIGTSTTNRLQGGWSDIPTSFNLASFSGGNISSTPSWAQASYGGVSLSKTANLMLNIEDIAGAGFDEATGQVILYGKQNVSLPQMELDDLSVAVRSVYGYGGKAPQDPGVSIGTEPSDISGQMKVRYDGQTNNTKFGLTMFEADRLLKCLTMGKDNITGQPISSSVSGYKNMLDRYKEAGSLSLPSSEFSDRMWFVPEEIKLVQSDDSSSMLFDKVKMQLLTESKFQNNVYSNPQAEAFASHFTQHYDEFSQERPILKELERLGKITSVVKWIKDNNIGFDLSFFESYTPQTVPTPQYTPQTQVSTSWTEGSNLYTLTITGGVKYQLDQSNFFTSTKPLANQTKEKAIISRPSETQFSWSFQAQNSQGQTEEYQAIAQSFSRSKKDGSIKQTQVDMSFPVQGDVPLALVRYYNSFDDKVSGFGLGWQLTPFSLRFPATKREFTFGNQSLKVNTYYEIYLREENSEYLYTLVGLSNDNLPIFKTEAGQDYLKDNLNGTFSLVKKNSIVITFNSEGRLTRITDSNGLYVDYNYNSGKLISIAHCQGRSISLNYTGTTITSATGPENRTITYTYYPTGQLKTVTNQENETTTYFYDSDKRLNKIVDPKGNTAFEASYDDYNRAYSQKIGTQANFTSEFSLADRLSEVTTPNNVKMTRYFDSDYRLIQVNDFLNNHLMWRQVWCNLLRVMR